MLESSFRKLCFVPTGIHPPAQTLPRKSLVALRIAESPVSPLTGLPKHSFTIDRLLTYTK